MCAFLLQKGVPNFTKNNIMISLHQQAPLENKIPLKRRAHHDKLLFVFCKDAFYYLLFEKLFTFLKVVCLLVKSFCFLFKELLRMLMHSILCFVI